MALVLQQTWWPVILVISHLELKIRKSQKQIASFYFFPKSKWRWSLSSVRFNHKPVYKRRWPPSLLQESHIHWVSSAAKLYKNTHPTEPKYKRNICNYTMPSRLGYLWSLSQTKIKGVSNFVTFSEINRGITGKILFWLSIWRIRVLYNTQQHLFFIRLLKFSKYRNILE